VCVCVCVCVNTVHAALHTAHSNQAPNLVADTSRLLNIVRANTELLVRLSNFTNNGKIIWHYTPSQLFITAVPQGDMSCPCQAVRFMQYSIWLLSDLPTNHQSTESNYETQLFT
jgi:hypothetical protein